MNVNVKTYGFKKGLPLEVEVKDLSEVKKVPHLFRGPAKADFYQIILLTKGTATFDIDFRDITIHAGELFIISANQVYGFDLTSDYEGQMVLFTDSFFIQTELDSQFLHTSEILSPGELNRTVKFEPHFLQTTLSLLEEELAQKKDAMQPYIAQSFLRIILLETERRISSNSSPMFHCVSATIGRRFLNEVEQHFRENRNTDFYVQLMGAGEKVLSRESKLLTGKTPKAYIDFRVILEAKRLLTYGNASIKEISADLGFDEPTNFNKYFRKHTRSTPVEFRQKSIKV